MAVDYTSVYEKHDINAEIAIGVTKNEIFFANDTDDKANKARHGSFNYLEIINDGATDITFRMDNLASRERKLFAKSVIVIKGSVRFE